VEPLAEYLRRLDDRHADALLLSRRERLVGNSRVGVFLAGVGVGVLSFGTHQLSAWWLLVPAVVFTVLLFIHERVTRGWYRAARAVMFYERGLARLDDAWAGKGQTGDRFADPNHPYSADLDLFGPASLFELLCTARTRTGEDTLAAWLRSAAGVDEVRARQAAVAELAPQLDLREDLALLGDNVPAGVDFDAVARWGGAAPVLVSVWPRVAALVLGAAGLVTLYFFLLLFTTNSQGTASPFFAVVLLDLALAGVIGGRVRRVLADVERRARDLALLANVLARLEQAEFSCPRLTELKAALIPHAGDTPPSQRIAALSNLLDLLNSRRNQLFAPFAHLLHWGTHIAYSVESWRRHSGKAIAGWLSAVGQFEALCALAAHSYENPDDPFPEVVTGPPCYEGEALGHPTIPNARCVRNDIKLGGELRVLVVSGSNMSGKSTFLRTVGINAVLALAGATVRARRLRLTPLAVGATLRIQDSLQAGRSRFYAEILRVRQVVDLARGLTSPVTLTVTTKSPSISLTTRGELSLPVSGLRSWSVPGTSIDSVLPSGMSLQSLSGSLPLLFLLDEIFAGTNSHDRAQGAESLVKGLVETGALGLVTTHDLTLTQIADRLGARGANVHFADRFVDGQMTFDYTLRPGVVDHSNALALMRAVGLEV
jgi:hypothetical protein